MSRAGLLRIAAAVCVLLVPAISKAQALALAITPPAQTVKAPPGFQMACDRYAWLCDGRPGEPAGITDERLRQMATTVNREVNRTVRQASDREIHGVAEFWALPERGRGDCEDLALAKMFRLLSLGVPATRLSMAIGLDRSGNNHAVLLVRTNYDYLLLDSLKDRIVTVGQAGYRMLAMQAAYDRSSWHTMDIRMTAHLGASAAVSQSRRERSRLALAAGMAPDR